MDGIGNNEVLTRVLPSVVNSGQCGNKHCGGKRDGGKRITSKSSGGIFPHIFSSLNTFFHTLFFGNVLKSRKCKTVKTTNQATNQAKAEKIAMFATTLNEYISSGIKIRKLPSLASKINKNLKDILTFVQKNNLSLDEISTLRTALTDFSGKEEVIRLYPGHSSSIKASDHNQYCFNIALKVEAIEILLDAKEKGYVGLERNGSPKPLGRGQYNVVQRAYTKKNKKGAVALKPCDRFKQKQDPAKFGNDSQSTQVFLGCTCGSYSRNKATSKVQDMFCAIGKAKRINVPRVVASVFAAEMDGVPCIAMKRLNGPTLWQAAKEETIKYDNDFICQETWLQLQDILTGQIDRHANNVILTKNGPVAFDNDLSFLTSRGRTSAGVITKTLSSIDGVGGVDLKNYCMPPVIDENMCEVIEAIELDKLENMYRKCGLTSLEIEPALARAQALKKKVEKLKQRGLVIKPNEWARSKKVRKHCNKNNFYALFHITPSSSD
ncbi:MAG: hypothetical protein LBD34_01845 [Puniceicoccales bacterium]|jgi:hypothetical protein|nr:hypothetical protein [Puniceicoccales bacterium]